MERDIITIDEDLCNGCGDCVPGCPEGALQIIDGKARLVGEVLCDGLGACVGDCPTGALTVERRQAEAYDERRVVSNMIPMGAATLIAHIKHLREHGEFDNVHAALDVIRSTEFAGRDEVLDYVRSLHNAPGPAGSASDEAARMAGAGGHHGGGGCPGSAAQSFETRPLSRRRAAGAEAVGQHDTQGAASAQPSTDAGTEPSALAHWPVQMHLINPGSEHFSGSDFVLAADCTAFSFGAFHRDFLAGKTLGIACPKLDNGLESYVEKIRRLVDEARINTLTVVIMQVPCCGGLAQVAMAGAQAASRKVPVKRVVVGIHGEILDEAWL